jgi:nucleotide-binding universal stress UspA family protein
MGEHPVIACYRGPDSADAVVLGTLLAGALDEPLVLASAYEYEPVGLSLGGLPAADNDRRADAALALLQHARQFVAADIEIREAVVPATDVAHALAGLAHDLDACLLTVGRDTSGRVTRSLLSRVSCPVAVAPLSVPVPRTALRHVGVAYDGSTTAQRAIVAASELALAAQARLVVLSAGATRERAAVWLQVGHLTLGRIGHEPRPLVGPAGEALAAASEHLDLLVCGTRGRGRVSRAILGDVSAHLVAEAQCPMLVVPYGSGVGGSGPLGLAPAAAST